MKDNKLGIMPISKLIWNMSLPIIVSMLVQALYNIVDSVFVSQVSEQALTAVTLAFPAQNLMIGLATGTAVGVNALLGRALGAGDGKRADQVAINGIFLAVVGFVLSAVLALCFGGTFFRTQTDIDYIVDNGIRTLILDASAACHMPDVLEMPYRPPLKDSGEADEKQYTYRLSSMTCLAGDVIGNYSFDHEIQIGDKLYFEDMAIYSMVKNNTFNGMCLPSIARMDENGECSVVKTFGYEEFVRRLG